MDYFLSFIVWGLNQYWPVYLMLVLVLWFLPHVGHRAFGFAIPFLAVISIFAYIIKVPIIDSIGVSAKGKVVAAEDTSIMTNYRSVKRRLVIYKLANGTLQESSFLSSTNESAPLFASVKLPNVGDEFDLKYLPHFPRYFIVLENVGAKECDQLRKQVADLNERIEFVPDDEKLKAMRSKIWKEYRDKCSR